MKKKNILCKNEKKSSSKFTTLQREDADHKNQIWWRSICLGPFQFFYLLILLLFLFHFISYMTWFYCEAEIVNKFSSTDHILWHFFMGYYILSFILFQKTLLKVKSTTKIKHYWNYYKRFFSFSVKNILWETEWVFYLVCRNKQKIV